ncbi:hypothetical protein N7530_009674 [Penicillium desertorum]|uniref:COX assembly mitochondrial protein n=1 Tax=Penicillium desertorum TaxID=1303715 RepID=A0A9W9WIW5_9EURO|nr:hypothetical protein N7530_009674 [Penicillium desertorum]
MATSSTSPDTSSTSAPKTTPKQYNLRNPLPLSAPPRTRSETAVLQATFAECAVNRTVTATWVCRQQRLAMNSCMVAHAKPEEEDRAREEWFAGYEDRRRAREEELARVEKRREEVIRMMREDEARTRAAGK